MARFSEIQLGDQVVIDSGNAWSDHRRIATVEKVTATQFVAGGIRFTKNGSEVGGDTYHSARVRMATDQLIAQVKAEIERQAFDAAIGKFRRLENMIQTRQVEISRPPRPLQLIANIKSALPHLQSALNALNAQQGEDG